MIPKKNESRMHIMNEHRALKYTRMNAHNVVDRRTKQILAHVRFDTRPCLINALRKNNNHNTLRRRRKHAHAFGCASRDSVTVRPHSHFAEWLTAQLL